MESRTDLAKHFFKQGYKVGAEVGVADGRYSEILCQQIPELELYCVDIWETYRGSKRTKVTQEEAYSQAQKCLSKYNVHIIKENSETAHSKVPSLDFVFLDGNHNFDYVMMDIILWSRKVRKGGIVAGHDYCHFTKSGIVEAVNKYTEVHRIELKLINRNHKNYEDDRQPCWWFKKNRR